MKKSDFNEKGIEELLSQMPKIQDKQDPDDLWMKISEQLEEEESTGPSKKSVHWLDKKYVIPTVLSLAAVLFFALLLPSMTSKEEMQISMNESSMSKESDLAEGRMELAPKSSQLKDSIENKEQYSIAGDRTMVEQAELAPINQTKVIAAIPENFDLITLAVPDNQAQIVIPISFLYPKSQYSITEAFEQAKGSIDEEALGLSTFMLNDATVQTEPIDNEKERIILNFPANFRVTGSAAEQLFMESIKESFRGLGYHEARLEIQGKSGVEISNYGVVSSVPLDEFAKKPYFKYQASSIFLVPGKPVDTIQEAFSNMQTGNETLGLQPTIMKDIKLDIKQIDKVHLIVQFNEETRLEDNPDFQTMIEAMLLTARDFGYETVTFEHPNQHRVGPYSLNEQINVPISPNPMPLIR